MKTKVFISYKSKDLPLVEKLKLDLGIANIDYWFDKENINNSNPIHSELEAAVKSCTHIILILSSKTFESEWVELELKFAKEHGLMVIPIVFSKENIEPIVQQLNSYFHIDLSDEIFEITIFEGTKIAIPKIGGDYFKQLTTVVKTLKNNKSNLPTTKVSVVDHLLHFFTTVESQKLIEISNENKKFNSMRDKEIYFVQDGNYREIRKSLFSGFRSNGKVNEMEILIYNNLKNPISNIINPVVFPESIQEATSNLSIGTNIYFIRKDKSGKFIHESGTFCGFIKDSESFVIPYPIRKKLSIKPGKKYHYDLVTGNTPQILIENI